MPMLFSKLIFFHQPVAKGVHYLLFLLCGWVLYPKELSLFQVWPHLNSVNLNPFSAHRLLTSILNFLGSILLTRKRKKQVKMEVSIPRKHLFPAQRLSWTEGHASKIYFLKAFWGIKIWCTWAPVNNPYESLTNIITIII